jgi:hypothetical protein
MKPMSTMINVGCSDDRNGCGDDGRGGGGGDGVGRMKRKIKSIEVKKTNQQKQMTWMDDMWHFGRKAFDDDDDQFIEFVSHGCFKKRQRLETDAIYNDMVHETKQKKKELCKLRARLNAVMVEECSARRRVTEREAELRKAMYEEDRALTETAIARDLVDRAEEEAKWAGVKLWHRLHASSNSSSSSSSSSSYSSSSNSSSSYCSGGSSRNSDCAIDGSSSSSSSNYCSSSTRSTSSRTSSSSSNISSSNSSSSSISSSGDGCGIDCPFGRLRTQYCSPSDSIPDAVFEERIEAALDDLTLAVSPTSSYIHTYPSTSVSINSNTMSIDEHAGPIGPHTSTSADSCRIDSSTTGCGSGIDCPFGRLRTKYFIPSDSSQQLDEETVFEERIETALQALETSESAIEAGRVALAWSWCVSSRSSSSSSFKFIDILSSPSIQTHINLHPRPSIFIHFHPYLSTSIHIPLPPSTPIHLPSQASHIHLICISDPPRSIRIHTHPDNYATIYMPTPPPSYLGLSFALSLSLAPQL